VGIGIPLCWASVFFVQWAPTLAAVAFPVGFLLYALGAAWLVLVVGHLVAGYRLVLADGICLVVVLACAIILLSGVVNGLLS